MFDQAFAATAAFSIAVALAGTAAADAATTISSAQWNTFVDGNAINACFPGFVVSFEDINATPGPPPVTISHADFEKLTFGAEIAKPMATEIVGPNPALKPAPLMAELAGDLVVFVFNGNGIAARGFVESAANAPPLDPGPSNEARALETQFAPALALVPKDAGLTQCGLTRVTFFDADSPDGGSSIQLILRAGKIVGAAETRL
jgi:hypothetical protein